MPAFYALGQHPALVELWRHFAQGSSCLPTSMTFMSSSLSQHLFRHARIEVHQGKTRAWNAAGLEPPGIRELGSTDAPVWVGDPALSPEQQGLVALGVPCGHPAYVAAQLQATLLQGIRSLPDLQSAWLLLLFCASPRCCHFLRSLPPVTSLAFAPMTRLSPPALRICWGPARSRTTRSALPSSLSSNVASTCGLRSPSLRPPIGPRGPTLFPCCTASSRASPPMLSPGLEPASLSAPPSEACSSHRQRLLRPGLTCPRGMP